MPESPEQIYGRVVSMVGEGGRLPTPPVHDWDTFPWDGSVTPRVVRPPVAAEKPRTGEEADDPCWACVDDDNVIWRNESWQVRSTQKPTGLPLVLFLETREHMDFSDMDDELASEFGRVTSWLHRIMSHLPNVGRVHVCKWGDGTFHAHTWFMARPARMPQLLGSYAAEWDHILPPVDEEVWRGDVATVARKLANHDGERVC